MNLWQLNVFYQVIKFQGFSRAASEIHLSQPTVSSHIKDLESYFGCKLIDRVDKKAIPTKAGEILYRYASKLLRLGEEAESAMAEFQGKISGKLMIGGSTIPGGYILPHLIGDFRKKYNDVMVSMTVGDTDSIVEKILDGSIELGVVGAKIKHKNIEQKDFVEDEMYLIVPIEHKWSKKKSIRPESLLDESFIIRERGSGTLKSILNSLEDTTLTRDSFKIVAEMGSTTAVIQAIKSGIGISILSPIAIKNELKLKTLKALKIEGVSFKRSFYLTWHKKRTPSPLNKTFFEFLMQTSEWPGF